MIKIVQVVFVSLSIAGCMTTGELRTNQPNAVFIHNSPVSQVALCIERSLQDSSVQFTSTRSIDGSQATIALNSQGSKLNIGLTIIEALAVYEIDEDSVIYTKNPNIWLITGDPYKGIAEDCSQ